MTSVVALNAILEKARLFLQNTQPKSCCEPHSIVRRLPARTRTSDTWLRPICKESWPKTISKLMARQRKSFARPSCSSSMTFQETFLAWLSNGKSACLVLLSTFLQAADSIGCCSLGLLVRKIADARLQDISESLCNRVTNVSGKKTEQRDIASIGLKTVISEISGQQAATLVHCTTPLLVDGLNKPVRQV